MLCVKVFEILLLGVRGDLLRIRKVGALGVPPLPHTRARMTHFFMQPNEKSRGYAKIYFRSQSVIYGRSVRS